MAPSWSKKSEKEPLLPLTAQHRPAAGKRTITIGLFPALIGEIEDALEVDIDHDLIKMKVACHARDPTRRSSGKVFVFGAADDTAPYSSAAERTFLFFSFCVFLSLAVWAIAAALALALGLGVDVFSEEFGEYTMLFGAVMTVCFSLVVGKKKEDEPLTPFLMWNAFCEVGRVLALIGCVLMAIVIAGQFITEMTLVPVVSKLAL